MRPRLVHVHLLLAVLLAGCSPVPPTPAPQICTKIGCESGLVVVVEGTPPAPYRVEARAAGESTRVRECPSAQECGQIFFADFLPAEVTVEVIAGSERSTRTVRPQVETVQPNGPNCPPTCSQAHVTVPWSSGQAGAVSR